MAESPTTIERARGTSWWRPALVAVGVIAVASTVFAVAAQDDGPDGGSVQPAAGDNPNESLTAHDGDVVRGAGTVVRRPDHPAVLCEPLPVADIPYAPGEEPPPECSTIAVPLTEVDEATLPDWTERDGVWFTGTSVTVDGVWRDGAVAVTTVAATEWPGEELDPDYWRVPCDPPPGGWLDGDGLDVTSPEDWENARRDLALEMAAHPDRYHSSWVGYPDGDALAPDAPKTDMGEPLPAHVVMIVSTVEDPATTRAQLAAAYPGNLCVVQVEFSAADLDAVVERLGAADTSWRLQPDTKANRVLLELPVLDDEAVRLIGSDAPLVEVRPLVRPT